MSRKITIPLLLVLALGVCVGGDCGGAALPAGLSATDVGCATKVAPDGLGFELIVPCAYKPNNDRYTPLGYELFVQAFFKEPQDGTNLIVLVGPPGITGSGVNEEFNEMTYEGTFTSSFGVELEIVENVNQSANMRQFLAAVELPSGNILMMVVTGFSWDAAMNKNTAELLYRSVKFTQ